MKTKIIIRQHLLPFKMDNTKMSTNNKALEMQEKVKPTISLMRVYIAAVTIENSMEAPQKLRTELLYDPTISFLGIYIWKK